MPLLPGYLGGKAPACWSAAVYVVANIRGGGEYGPAWHQAALKQNRHRAYEDFAAVAEDLITRKVTSAPHLGARGGNGGLLVGNMLTLYPQLFGCIVCEVPLLDMQRYTRLSAGASWIAEYGDPSKPEEWAYIKTFSPYHNIQAQTAIRRCCSIPRPATIGQPGPRPQNGRAHAGDGVSAGLFLKIRRRTAPPPTSSSGVPQRAGKRIHGPT